VNEGMGQEYDGLYQWLGTNEGENEIYRMAKSEKRKTTYIIQVKCINDTTENRWQEYFNKLLNEDSGNSSIELNIHSDDLNTHFVRRI
jgi:hypothetical protein